MSPISWSLVPDRRRRPAGRRCLEVLPRVSAKKTAAARTPDPGHGGQDLVKRVGLHQGLDLGGDIGPLGVQGDELPGQVGQHHCCGVGAGDHHGLALQSRDDLAGPSGVPPAPVLLEPGVNLCLACALQIGWGRPGGNDLQDGVVLQPGPHHGLEGGVDLGVQAPDPVRGLVDLAGQE